MDVAVLGPVEASVDGRPIALGGGKRRALLAMLALNAGSSVSAARLIDGLWGERPPATANKLVQVYVAQLRKALAASGDGAEIVTRRHGYELRLGAGAVDAKRFERLIAQGAPRQALGLWRGPPLDDVAEEPFAVAEIRRLEELRLAAHELAIEHDVNDGRHREVIAELEALVVAEPLRERLHALLMLALYRSGRQADALAVYRQARDMLVEQLGIEPGPDLRELERAILAQDPTLDLARPVADVRATATRIPAPPTPTIGRETDLARLRADLLGESAGRLMTLVGPGGVGKTRLALEVARAVGQEFHDGSYFVALGPVGGFEDVASTIVRELDVALLPSESPERALARHLGDREVLLVLDNFEHVLDAAPLVADLLASTSRLRALVTSREPLRLRAERLFRLEPLALPSLGTDRHGTGVQEAPAVALFLAVAHAQNPSFALGKDDASAVARVCRRLDGLPLAIELAAARVGLLTVPELAARLRDGLDALGPGSRDAPARQRTLAATLEWSYALLNADERAAFAGLGVLAGGCTVEAAQAVTGASLDVLEALVAKNLVVRRSVLDGASRLMLLETVADFARERLAERSDADRLRERHLDYYLALTERAAPELQRSDPPALIAELDLEVHNLRAALAWALDQHAALPALRLATALLEYWNIRDLGREGARWLRAALDLSNDDAPASLRAAALAAHANCLLRTDTLAEAEAAARESLALARSIGDVAQCAASTTALAVAALDAHRSDDAYRYATEAERLAREAGDEPKRVDALHIKALSAPTLKEALALGELAAAAYQGAGSGRRLAVLQSSLTYIALVHGDDAAAQQLTPAALQAAETVGDPFVLSFAHGNEGLVALFTGDVRRAADAFRQELELATRHQHDLMLYEAISGLAGVAAARFEDERAARLLGAAEGTRPERHEPAIAGQLEVRVFAAARARIGDPAWQSAYAAGAALTTREAVDAALSVDSVVSRANG